MLDVVGELSAELHFERPDAQLGTVVIDDEGALVALLAVDRNALLVVFSTRGYRLAIHLYHRVPQKYGLLQRPRVQMVLLLDVPRIALMFFAICATEI